ncbi:MAG: hypothetical protein APR54_06685 [Candidatus Cloacimonas sp. SDB]|nr:MAG: hypothetical protein APR54_06685 [Candidatus Cloacimonas sp. SDB]
MGKFFVIIVLSAFLIPLFAEDFQQPVQEPVSLKFYPSREMHIDFCSRNQDPPPEYSFIPNGDGDLTTFLAGNWYDYMPYGYNGHSLRLQTEISQPYGYSAGGIYISYHLSDNQYFGTNRKAWFSYLNPDMTLNISSPLTDNDRRKGFVTNDIDPITGDPFFTWHSPQSGNYDYDCFYSYDLYNQYGSPGLITDPILLINNPEIGIELTGHEDDEFLWPVIWIGSSPIEDHRRIHIYANNYTINQNGRKNYNSVFGFADFNYEDLIDSNDLVWSYRTFPTWDNNHYNDICRINKDLIVKENKVAFFGSYGDTLFCYLSEDYGDTFSEFTQEWLYPIANPLHENGETYQFYNNDEITPAELYFCLSNDGKKYNGVFSDNDSKIIWMTGININTQENREQGSYMAAYFYPKIFSFNVDSGTFDFYDMDIQGVDPVDDQPAIPWDLNEDGIVDQYNDDGSVYIPLSMCSYFFNADQGYQDAFFQESTFRMSANNSWIVALWYDCKKLYQAHFEVEGYESWEDKHEIVISISDDCGDTWSDPLFINANSEDVIVDSVNHFNNHFEVIFEDMIPVYFTLGEKLEILSNSEGNYHAKFHLAFYDDPYYGAAAIETTWPLVGEGDLRYAALDIEFQEPWLDPTSTEDNTIVNKLDYIKNVHPNPFNPATNIEFYLSKDSEIRLEIFNVRGQKVRELVNDYFPRGEHSIKWFGLDDNNSEVCSGIYFSKLITENNTDVFKMVLLK